MKIQFRSALIFILCGVALVLRYMGGERVLYFKKRAGNPALFLI
jgi:hypothetical protein